MSSNKIYKKLLNRMLIVEILGERLYNELALKTKEEGVKSIYQKLAVNEHKTAEHIKKELGIHLASDRIAISNLAKSIFSLLPSKCLSLILRNALKKRMYCRWYNVNKNENQEFWNKLLEHESIQHELLTPVWNQEKE